MLKKNFAQKIIEWYRENKRALPWRETKDPYKIWLSEIILQQTRVVQGIPYYLNFIAKFPTVETLAAASQEEVLRQWQGLGYYSRARNLHRCAQIISGKYNGKFPKTYDELLTLPGIGSYTAAAIASLAFRVPVAVVDGNVYRVIARIFGIEKDVSDGDARDVFFRVANEMISLQHPDEYNQGMMEFGAIHCVPQNPKCETCIFAGTCFANLHGMQGVLPVKTKRTKVRKRYLYYFVIEHDRRLSLQKRESKDIWQGLYDFHSIESSKPESADKIIAGSQMLNEFRDQLVIGEPSPVYNHILTHQTISAQFIPVKIISDQAGIHDLEGKKLTFYSSAEIHDLPKPVLVSRHLSDLGIL